MKNMNLLIWLTQLGLSVAVPLAGFIFLGIWLHDSWGQWTIWVGIILGVTGAADGLRQSLKAMQRMSGNDQEKEPPVSFNDHD